MSDFLRAYLTVAIFGATAGLLVASVLGLGRLIRPSRPSVNKLTTYESGVDPIGSGFSQSQIRYYIFALLFVLFDVEAVFIFPWAMGLETYSVFGLVEVVTFEVGNGGRGRRARGRPLLPLLPASGEAEREREPDAPVGRRDVRVAGAVGRVGHREAEVGDAISPRQRDGGNKLNSQAHPRRTTYVRRRPRA